ncbi:Las1-like-domain-containing protein [Gloeopeniophorella convolvens]|nr:Las1-like-domain-containing protein [Gloeopeniophorella convolvens]
MQLPRRVPWATLAELDQLCSWVYSEDANDRTKSLAIDRLAAWKFMTPLPHALESLLSILVAVHQDAVAELGSSSSLSLRQSYATAVIRLVNGLVDPLQAGTYARSILSIAAQIGLPAWLVELRHAATHEDLPSLKLLRDASKESLNWLLHNYFLLTLNPTLEPPPARPPLRPLEPLLKQYKSLLKLVSRDASLRARHAPDIDKVLRDVERWLAEARIAADASAREFAWQAGERGTSTGADDEDEDDPREAWALERLCEALLVRGALVPVSRKKRAAPKGMHHPPPALLVIWAPLLESLSAAHARFQSALTAHIVAHLVAEPQDVPDEAAAAERASYDVCLAAWAAWLVEWRRADEADAAAARRQDAFLQLVQALGPQREASPRAQAGARALLTALCAADVRLAEIADTVLDAAQVSADESAWHEADMDVMDARLKALLALPASRSDNAPHAQDGSTERGASSAASQEDEVLPPGWRLLSEADGWQPCPIGVYIGRE